MDPGRASGLDGGGAPVLIAAQSGRALAMAARRAGYRPLVADLFADRDTRAAADAALAVEGALATGFRRDGLIAALDRLAAAAPAEPVGLVLGSGFEDRPRLIERLAARWRLIGTPGPAVRAVKDPFGLAAACRQEGIPHPAVGRAVPEGGNWLVRRIGGSGGGHVRPARRPGPLRDRRYAQARAPGVPVSLGFLADGRDIAPVGFCRQWPSPAPGAPFRFGGIAGPIGVPAAVADGLRRAALALTRRFGLLGLASADALVDGEDWTLLEINPRPGASLDVLDCGDVPLFAAHVAACKGQLHEIVTGTGRVRGLGVVYAEYSIAAVLAADWPAWVFDRPEAGTPVGAGEPVVSVMAEADGVEAVERQLQERARLALRAAGGPERGTAR